MRHDLPGVTLYGHTIGGGVPGQGKKRYQCRQCDADDFAHRFSSIKDFRHY
jgi:hypothetical protein